MRSPGGSRAASLLTAAGVLALAVGVGLLLGLRARPPHPSHKVAPVAPAVVMPGPTARRPADVLVCARASADLREKPDAAAELVSQVLYGQSLRVIRASGSWLQVTVPEQGDYEGWIARAATAPLATEAAALPPAVVCRPALQVRASGPHSGGWPDSLPGGSVVRIRGRRGAVAELVSVNGVAGTADAAALSGSPTPRQPVTIAQEYRGTRYLWGGLTRAGIDCSGLVWAAHRQCGISVPRDAHDQAPAGQPIARANLQPGDCVFFSSGGTKATHVGLFLGAGRFIHASPARGVAVSRLSEPYYARRYLCAARFSAPR